MLTGQSAPQAQLRVATWVWLLPFGVLVLMGAIAFPLFYAAQRVSRALPSASSPRQLGLPPTKPASAPADPDRQLSEKLDTFVSCVNDRPRQSRDRYLSWVDGEQGPTGREAHISYGLYEVSVDPHCQGQLGKAPSLPPSLAELDGAMRRYAEVVLRIAPIITRAAEYYEAADYKDDGAAKAKQMHPALMRAFGEFDEVYGAALAAVEAVAVPLTLREIAHAEIRGDSVKALGARALLEARRLMGVAAAMNPRDLRTLDLPRYCGELEPLQARVDQFGKAAEQPGAPSWAARYRSSLLGFLKEAKGLRRRAERKQQFVGAHRSWLGTPAGWMVNDSPDAMRHALDEVLRQQAEIFGNRRFAAL